MRDCREAEEIKMRRSNKLGVKTTEEEQACRQVVNLLCIVIAY